MKLILKLIAGIVVGIVIGLFVPEFLIRLLITIKLIFGNFLAFVVPFIVFFFVASGISGLGKQSGRIVGFTIGIAYFSTLLAGILAFVVASQVVPLFSPDQSVISEHVVLAPFFDIDLTPVMSVMTAIVSAFLFGIGVAKTETFALKKVIDEGKAVIDLVITKIIIPFLPFYIASIFANLTAEGAVAEVLSIFAVVLLLAVTLHWVWLTTQYIIAGLITGKNPWHLLKNMFPAYVAAVGAMSSVAVIPVTLRGVKNNGVKENVANFSVPLCATIHLSGSMITIVTCAFAVMTLTAGLSIPSFTQMLPVIFMLALIMVAAPSVPGGGIMAAIGILTSMLGFTETAIGLMIALYIAQDGFGTATNVTGDGAINVVIDQSVKHQEEKANV